MVLRASLAVAYSADHVAGRQLVIFERDQSLAVGCLRAFGFGIGTTFSGAAVHGIVQLDAVQREIVLAFTVMRDFFDRIDLRVAAGMRDLHRRARSLCALR